MIRYNRLFEIKIYHEFYGAHDMRDLSLYPLAETNQYIAGLQLICKKTPEGIIVLYNEQKKSLLETLKEVYSFKFGIKITNRFYLNFSRVPSRITHQKHFLTNRENTSLAEGDFPNPESHILLHPGPWLNEETVSFSCGASTRLQSILSDEELVISAGDDTCFEGKLPEDATASAILTKGYGSYSYQSKETEEQYSFQFVPDALEHAMAVIDISVGGDMAFDTVQGTSFYARIASREVMSNYFFINGGSLDFESVDIISEKQVVETTEPEKAMLPNGQEATKVTVAKPYTMKKNSEVAFAAEYILLPANEHDLAVKKKINLPRPDLRKIKAKREGEAEVFFTDMYVYL